MEGEERRGKGCVGRDGVSARRDRERGGRWGGREREREGGGGWGEREITANLASAKSLCMHSFIQMICGTF